MGFREKLFVCATIESETKEDMVKSMEMAKEEGADLVELCMESISHNMSDVELVLRQRTLPAIVSFRYPVSVFFIPHYLVLGRG
ncbi:hypothetical protein OSB04_020217 [Centaurea solstitialis]|uniref:Uncharacterized protein n=1 Tax=Centaurea solstitialis TaxID=347529 RepID=A0AA38STF2_9ASTR|nr:hypothetical protein OSB04_020217 [Centaurea solstitialis]